MVQTTSPVEVPTGNQPALRVVAVTSLISLVCIFCAIWSWMPSWKDFDRFPGLICILPFWMPYGFVLLRLHQGRIKSGMALAAAMGCALFVPGLFLVRFVIEWQRSWWIVINLAVASLMQPVLVVAAVWALRFLEISRRDWLKISITFLYGIVLFKVFWLAYSPIPRQIIYSETRAKDRLREISWNNVKGFDFLLNSSSPPTGKGDCGSDHLFFLLHPNPDDGYDLMYRSVVSETSARGCKVDTGYIITARPAAYRKTGIRSFLVDQSKPGHKWPQQHSIRIHFTSEDRPATLDDPAEDVELFTHRVG